MTYTFRFALFLLLLMSANLVSAQDSVATKPVVDVVWLKDGSNLSGTIIRLELARGMEIKLITGAIVQIPKEEIVKVYQDLPFSSQASLAPDYRPRGPRPYAFREEGLYQTFSGFISFSEPGGAGVHYSIGHRFSRMLSVGIGAGFESNDFWYTRNMVPLYAEARGFLVPKRISPYYAVKLGYGFALEDPINGTLDTKGGILFCPEFGVRFGGRTVNYYLGLEYKIQNATWRTTDWWNGGEFTDKVSYRRLELRTGLVF